MKIRKPGNLTGAQIGFATILGVLGGIYIWRPYFIQYQQQSKETQESNSTQN
jgi:hypothetical protein